MPKARAKPDPRPPAEKPAAKGARVATTLEEATEIGLFGNEVDPTDDSAYTVVGTASPSGHYAVAGVIPAPKES